MSVAFSPSVDLDVDSSPTQLSRRRAHGRAMSRVRRLALGLALALAFTSGLGAALAVQLAQTGGGSSMASRAPRLLAARAGTLKVIDGASEKHVEPHADAPKPARRARAAAPSPSQP